MHHHDIYFSHGVAGSLMCWCGADAGKVQEAVDRERKVWKQRLIDADQEAEDLRGQLSEITNTCGR